MVCSVMVLRSDLYQKQRRLLESLNQSLPYGGGGRGMEGRGSPTFHSVQQLNYSLVSRSSDLSCYKFGEVAALFSLVQSQDKP